MKRKFLYVCTLWLILVSGISAYAFELKSPAGASPDVYMKWDVTTGPVRIVMNSKGSDNMPVAHAENELLEALNVWQNVTGQALRFQYEGRQPGVGQNGSDFLNSISWKETDWQHGDGVVGITRYSFYLDAPDTIIDSDIVLNGQDYRWSTDGTKGTVDVQSILTHELGHLIGLAHTGVRKASLFPYYGGADSVSLSSDDIAGIRFIYGVPIQKFKPITPVGRALYSRNLAAKNLPLPIFRWNPALYMDFAMEFSNTYDFKRKITITANQRSYHTLTAAQEKRLLALAVKNKLFWRVRSGGMTTPPRALFFEPK